MTSLVSLLLRNLALIVNILNPPSGWEENQRLCQGNILFLEYYLLLKMNQLSMRHAYIVTLNKSTFRSYKSVKVSLSVTYTVVH